jgi:hypothetical protein
VIRCRKALAGAVLMVGVSGLTAQAAAAAPVVSAQSTHMTFPQASSTTSRYGVEGMRIDSASGCSGEVCIDVVGNGTYVDYIDVFLASGLVPEDGGTAVILFKGSTDWPGGVFGFVDETYGAHVIYETDFPSTGQVCGEILNYVGKPCEEIE